MPARLAATVDLPTPPFPLAMAIRFPRCASGSACILFSGFDWAIAAYSLCHSNCHPAELYAVSDFASRQDQSDRAEGSADTAAGPCQIASNPIYAVIGCVKPVASKRGCIGFGAMC